jgi:hypothetical protein
VAQWIQPDGCKQADRRGDHVLMAGDPGRLVSGRRATGTRATVHRAEIVRRAEIDRIARVARLGASAPPGQAARQRARQVPGQVASNVRIGTATTTTGVARAGLHRCAAVGDGMSRSWLKRARRPTAWLCRHRLSPRRWRRRRHPRQPSSRPSPRRSSYSRTVVVGLWPK